MKMKLLRCIRLAAWMLSTLVNIPSATAMSTNYMVFFEYGDATLSSSAIKTIDQFVADKSKVPAGCLLVTIEAHLDSAEAKAGGTAVGDRRLSAVTRYIEEKTERRYAIQAWNFRATLPLVLTKEEAQEPQNRRVSIDTRWAPDVRTEVFNCLGSLCQVKAWLPDGTSCDRPNPPK